MDLTECRADRGELVIAVALAIWFTAFWHVLCPDIDVALG
jgi:hypothetical protein